MIRIGIDIGGTFTDFAVWRDTVGGYTNILSFKVPSTPPDFANAVRTGLDQMIENGTIATDDEILLVHGTTVSTNAVIERSGPILALLVTKGFPDVLNIQRLRLDKPIDMFNRRTDSLVAREHVFEIDERLLSDGTVEQPLRDSSVRDAVSKAADAGAQALAVCFLHSYQNPAHEIAARDIIASDKNGLSVTISSEIWPQQNEYERAVVAVLNSYVRKIVGDYIGEIEDYLKQKLPGAKLFITKSNGGVMASEVAYRHPVHTMLSGPAAGVTAAQFVSDILKMPDLLTMDMGGTSTDMSLIRGGQVQVSSQAEGGDFPLMMPVTAIEAIGAGGGSIARMDGPILKVGPRSAGARPGPACYGQGGKEPTLTDAYLVCGYINPDYFLEGRMKLRRDLAEDSMKPIAEAMGVDVVTAAESCITVGTSNMLTRVLPFLASLGVSPRELTLTLYGGAGAVHGPLLAEELGVERVLVPRTPSVFCAFGGLVSDLMHDAVRTVIGSTLDGEGLREVFSDLEKEARSWLDAQADPRWLSGTDIFYYAEMRYQGQSFQVDVGLDGKLVASADMQAIEKAFHDEHLHLYNHADLEAPVEIQQLRVRALSRMTKPAPEPLEARDKSIEEALLENRRLRLQGIWHDQVPVYRRSALGPEHPIAGPAIIEQGDSTILVPATYSAETGDLGDLILTLER